MKKPKWLRPEINTAKYWVHIAIIAVIVQFVLGLFGHDVGAIPSVHTLHFSIAIVAADVIAHTLLGFD